jgi:N-methylhydantoinase B
MSSTEARTQTVDAITAEVVRNAVVSITDEMKTNLMRTAYNMIIYEAEDFTVGLFDAEGNTISIGLGLPMFIRGLSDTIKAKLAFWGRENIEPGDILLTNDAYIMGSHLNHMIFTMPVFHEGELVAFSSSMAHWQDVGGVLGSGTRDIFSEGLQLPFVKIFKAGKQDEELTAIIRMNVRLPELAMGDFRAQVAAIRTGERRLSRLLQRYGSEAFKQSIEMIYDQSERQARAAVSAIPDGVYEGESFMDDDGVVLGKPLPIKVRVEIRGDEMTIDLSDVSLQVAGHYNSGATAGRSACEVAFKCLTTPVLLPINEGSFRPLKIVLPPGRVVSATKPSPMRMWMTIPMTVVDTVFKAVADACPDRVAAGHHADLISASPHGFEPGTGRVFFGQLGPLGGGWGAKLGEDGNSATICINDGDTHNAPVEAAEAKAPILVEERSLREDSSGAGQWRGGLGIRQQVKMLQQGVFNASVERTKCSPWGLFGGKDAVANKIDILRADGTVEEFENGKIYQMPLAKGDGYLNQSGGGGGFGDPLKRPIESVLRDVTSGYVSVEAARRDYGVVAELDGRKAKLDEPKTAALRGDMETKRDNSRA